MQMSMRNGVTPKLKLTLTLTLTLTDTGDAVLTLMLGHRSLYITWQQYHNCRIVCELSLRILICILPLKPVHLYIKYHEIAKSTLHLKRSTIDFSINYVYR